MSEITTNIKVRLFENCNICRAHYKQALGFTFRLDKDYRGELFIVPFLNGDKIQMLRGNGHIRMEVKRSFREDLKNIDPDFPALLAFYGEKGEKIKNFIAKCRGI